MTLYYYKDTWNVASNENPVGKEKITYTFIKEFDEKTRKLKIDGLEGRFYHYEKKVHYNPWKFFEDDVMNIRFACWNFMRNTRRKKKNNSKSSNQVTQNEVEEENNKKKQERKDLVLSNLFWGLWNKKGMKFPSEEDQDKVFTFEINLFSLSKYLELTGENRDLEEYEDQDTLELSGVRDMTTRNELDPRQYEHKYNWSTIYAKHREIVELQGEYDRNTIVGLVETLRKQSQRFTDVGRNWVCSTRGKQLGQVKINFNSVQLDDKSEVVGPQ